MATLNGSINLLKYKDARKVIIAGVKGIFIPVDENPTIFVGGKGAYANVRIVEHESTFDDSTYSHFISASFGKSDDRKKYEETFGSEALRAVTPILGNLAAYQDSRANESEESYVAAEDVKDDGDLPF